jgi:hypothetical protein
VADTLEHQAKGTPHPTGAQPHRMVSRKQGGGLVPSSLPSKVIRDNSCFASWRFCQESTKSVANVTLKEHGRSPRGGCVDHTWPSVLPVCDWPHCALCGVWEAQVPAIAGSRELVAERGQGVLQATHRWPLTPVPVPLTPEAFWEDFESSSGAGTQQTSGNPVGEAPGHWRPAFSPLATPNLLCLPPVSAALLGRMPHCKPVT